MIFFQCLIYLIECTIRIKLIIVIIIKNKIIRSNLNLNYSPELIIIPIIILIKQDKHFYEFKS